MQNQFFFLVFSTGSIYKGTHDAPSCWWACSTRVWQRMVLGEADWTIRKVRSNGRCRRHMSIDDLKNPLNWPDSTYISTTNGLQMIFLHFFASNWLIDKFWGDRRVLSASIWVVVEKLLLRTQKKTGNKTYYSELFYIHFQIFLLLVQKSCNWLTFIQRWAISHTDAHVFGWLRPETRSIPLSSSPSCSFFRHSGYSIQNSRLGQSDPFCLMTRIRRVTAQ